jgi:hypothetical protein
MQHGQPIIKILLPGSFKAGPPARKYVQRATVRDFKLPPQCKRGLRSSVTLRSKDWPLVTDVSWQPVGFHPQGSSIPRRRFHTPVSVVKLFCQNVHWDCPKYYTDLRIRKQKDFVIVRSFLREKQNKTQDKWVGMCLYNWLGALSRRVLQETSEVSCIY